MPEITRFYQQGASLPSFVRGACVACRSVIPINSAATYEDNEVISCQGCGARLPRRRLIRQALANLDAVTWSLFGSDLYISDQFDLNPGDHVRYDLSLLQQVKWHHEEAFPNFLSGSRYIAQTFFLPQIGLVSLRDIHAPALQAANETGAEQPTDGERSPVSVFWWRFGLKDREAVPAWRQSLQGAATLVNTNPSAALVLIAAGFESFFIETMRIGWLESGLEPAGFERLNKRNLPISNLVEWLSAAVGRPSLPNDNSLFERWKSLVNQRRNDVVHRAIVHFTAEQAMESMSAALECVEFIDACGLVRPHAYYRRGEAQATGYSE